MEGQEMARRLGAEFYETSALSNIHIEDAFSTLVRLVKAQTDSGAKPGQPEPKKKKPCTLV
jgi:hypothetical protein